MGKSLIYRRPASHPAEQLQVQCCRHIKSRGVLYLWRAKSCPLTRLSIPGWAPLDKPQALTAHVDSARLGMTLYARGCAMHTYHSHYNGNRR